MHHPGMGLLLPFPVLMEEDNDITIDDIEKWLRGLLPLTTVLEPLNR